MTERELLTALIGAEIGGTGGGMPTAVSLETLERVYSVSKAHDVAHIVGAALVKQGLLREGDALWESFSEQQERAVCRYGNSAHTLDLVCRTLERAGIPHIPLKGSVLCRFYPEPWMRVGCDIDVLVPKGDLARATQALTEAGFARVKMTDHDISLNSPGGVCTELHYRLGEEGEDPCRTQVLDSVWEHTAAEDGWTYRLTMSPELFLCYHIAHMAKHMVNAGCGIRPFLDLWIIRRRMDMDRDEAKRLLSACGLWVFAQAAEDLCDVWFSGKTATPLTRRLETYALDSGAYGHLENAVMFSAHKRGGKLNHALGRVFVPYNSLKLRYPRLSRYPVLYPYYWVKRCFHILCSKDSRERAAAELKYTAAMDSRKQQEVARLLEQLELVQS